jgi:hypothetical protein
MKKSILDSGFRYVPAIDTDVGATFRRVKKEQERAKREAEDARRQVTDLLTRKPLCK